MATTEKYLDIEKDRDLQRWLRNVRRGSPVHAEIVRRQLGSLCEPLFTTPEGMVEQAKINKKRFQDSFEDLVAHLKAESKSLGYIVGLLKAVRSWLRCNDVAPMHIGTVIVSRRE